MIGKALLAVVLVAGTAVPAFADGFRFEIFTGRGKAVYETGDRHHQPYRHRTVEPCNCGYWKTIEKKVWVPGYYEKVWVPPRTETIRHGKHRGHKGRYGHPGKHGRGHQEVCVVREGYYRNVWHEGYYKTERERVWMRDDNCHHRRDRDRDRHRDRYRDRDDDHRDRDYGRHR